MSNKFEPISLKYRLHKNLGRFQSDRGTKFIHASDLMNPMQEFCEREVVLLDTLKQKRPDKFVHTSQAVAFEVSSMMQKLITE